MPKKEFRQCVEAFHRKEFPQLFDGGAGGAGGVGKRGEGKRGKGEESEKGCVGEGRGG